MYSLSVTVVLLHECSKHTKTKVHPANLTANQYSKRKYYKEINFSFFCKKRFMTPISNVLRTRKLRAIKTVPRSAPLSATCEVTLEILNSFQIGLYTLINRLSFVGRVAVLFYEFAFFSSRGFANCLSLNSLSVGDFDLTNISYVVIETKNDL